MLAYEGAQGFVFMTSWVGRDSFVACSIFIQSFVSFYPSLDPPLSYTCPPHHGILGDVLHSHTGPSKP
jgi:hypothetical protein